MAQHPTFIQGQQTELNQHALELTYDRQSFWLNGERIFLNSATIHYFRMPKEEWRDVLLKAKLAGMNCIDTYFAWNVHEPEEGQWDFEGDRDCGAFLDLCAELGMWVIARPGPFICAEWDFGGFPYWLGTKPDIAFRENNDVYLHYVDAYFDRIIPIIRDRQLSAGGPVILVQVENEYGYLKDDDAASAHMNRLRDALLQRGIDVPLITCVGGAEGTIEGANFWSGADGHYAKLRAKQPDTPKMVTEFWTGWFEHWGGASAIQKTAPLLEKRIMEILRAGYTGISYYMFYGGTNFGGYGGRTVGSSDIFMITSYDYDAPLNEYGRGTAKYDVTKRWSYFVNAFDSVLLQAEEIPEEQLQFRHGSGISVRGRAAGDQRILFVESHKEERETVQVTLEDGRTLPVSLHPGQIMPLLDRVRIANDVRLTGGTFIAGNEQVGGELTLFVAADTGQRSIVELEAPSLRVLDSTMAALYTHDAAKGAYRFDLAHFREPGVIRLQCGNTCLRLIVLDMETMNRTWRLEGEASGDAVRYAIGFDDVRVLPSGQVQGMLADADRTILLLGGWENGERSLNGHELCNASSAQRAGALPVPPKLSAPEVSLVELSAEYASRTGQPEAFSDYGQDFGYLLYECEFQRETADDAVHLIMTGVQDSARIYVNGVEQALVRQVGAAAVPIRTVSGHNKLQVLVQQMGRLNFSPYLGESKGLFGPVAAGGAVQDIRRDWQTEQGTIHLDEVHPDAESSVIRRSFVLEEGMDRAILVGAVSKGIRMNGVEVPMDGYHDWFAFTTLDLSPYVKQGTNTLEMPYRASPLARLELILYRSTDELSGWKMAGSDQLLPRSWQPYAAEGTSADGRDRSMQKERSSALTGHPLAKAAYGRPVWYRFSFQKPDVPEPYHANLMVRLTGMSKGAVVLNGHDLGRYWQIGPQEDYKIPMAWLKEENELLLFDEEGASPERVRLLYDVPSRYPWVQVE